MKRLVTLKIWAGVFLTALLLVPVPSAQGQQLCEYGPCCGPQYVTSGTCRTQHWKPNQQKCKETFYDWDWFFNTCNGEDTFFFEVVFDYKYFSTEAACPDENDCPNVI